jgi:hypothetical protein
MTAKTTPPATATVDGLAVADLAALAAAVRDMRDAQRKYFQHKTKDYLIAARTAESKVDGLLRRLATP